MSVPVTEMLKRERGKHYVIMQTVCEKPGLFGSEGKA